MNIIPYDFSGKTVRFIIDEKGNPWWLAKDVCCALGLSNVSKALMALEPDEKSDITGSKVGYDVSKLRIINEPGLYRLCARSNKKRAKKFQRWVFHDVLPQIRKTGAYQVQNLTRLEILKMAIDSEEARIKLEIENKVLKPKAQIYDFVSGSTGLVCIRDCAKILNIRPHAFSARLKSDGYCFMSRNKIVAYDQFIKRGWFEMKLVPARDGSKTTYRQTFITPLGTNKFREIYNPGQKQLRIFA